MQMRDVNDSVLLRQLDLPAAWARVNGKAGAPGVDDVDTLRFATTSARRLTALRARLADSSYIPCPLRAMSLERPRSAAPRHLLIPTITDRIAQTALHGWLLRSFENVFDEASFAYRPGRGVHAALRKLTELRSRGLVWVARGDVRNCFDRVSHVRLLHLVKGMLGGESPFLLWIATWIAAPAWDGTALRARDVGVPQGAPLSPWLANLYLDAFDRELRQAGVEMIRYADDFVLAARNPQAAADAVAVARRALAQLQLGLNDGKTLIASFEKGFQFLGATFQGDRVLVPFEPTAQRASVVRLAPPMPPALLRAWELGLFAPATVPLRAWKEACA